MSSKVNFLKLPVLVVNLSLKNIKVIDLISKITLSLVFWWTTVVQCLTLVCVVRRRLWQILEGRWGWLGPWEVWAVWLLNLLVS